MQVAELQGSHQAIRTSANALVLKSRAKEAANAKLWEQVLPLLPVPISLHIAPSLPLKVHALIHQLLCSVPV